MIFLNYEIYSEKKTSLQPLLKQTRSEFSFHKEVYKFKISPIRRVSEILSEWRAKIWRFKKFVRLLNITMTIHQVQLSSFRVAKGMRQKLLINPCWRSIIYSHKLQALRETSNLREYIFEQMCLLELWGWNPLLI